MPEQLMNYWCWAGDPVHITTPASNKLPILDPFLRLVLFWRASPVVCLWMGSLCSAEGSKKIDDTSVERGKQRAFVGGFAVTKRPWYDSKI
jgi:hypothetical protein